MSRKIDKLTENQLSMWQNISRQIWLFEHATVDESDFTVNDMLTTRDIQQQFIEGCIREYDIDETRPFRISEATGLIYYLED